MDLHLLTNSWLFTYLMIPLLIMCARICDVTIGTIRIIFISRGRRNLAPFLGFFEVMIWITAMGQVMQNVNNPVTYIAYGIGFAIGNFVGMLVEEKLAIGHSIIRVVTHMDITDIKQKLVALGYGITIQEGVGARGKVNILFTVVQRKDARDAIEVIETYGDHVFYSVEDAKCASFGVFPQRANAFGTFFRSVGMREKLEVKAGPGSGA